MLQIRKAPYVPPGLARRLASTIYAPADCGYRVTEEQERVITTRAAQNRAAGLATKRKNYQECRSVKLAARKTAIATKTESHPPVSVKMCST